jgi:hypothetical protein
MAFIVTLLPDLHHKAARPASACTPSKFRFAFVRVRVLPVRDPTGQGTRRPRASLECLPVRYGVLIALPAPALVGRINRHDQNPLVERPKCLDVELVTPSGQRLLSE